MRIKDIQIKGKKYQLVSDFRDNDEIREQFFELPKTMFCVDFKPWYEAGLWTEKYNPYCIMDEGKLVSNVSMYHQDFVIDGKVKHLIQLGGVCTYEAYRNRGLSRYIMEEIIEEYKDQCDSLYLMANDTVLDFYPRFGFEASKEYQYVTMAKGSSDNYHARKLDPKNSEDLKLVETKVGCASQEIELQTVNQTELVLFYWFICNACELRYIEELDTIVNVEYGDGQLVIDNIYGDAAIEEVINALVSKEPIKVILGFKPKNAEKYEVEEYYEDGTTLFIHNKAFKEEFDSKKLKFVAISHT